MQPSLEKINKPFDQSFYSKEVYKPYFTAPWHFHPEIEILLVMLGNGSRYVGDSIKNFYPGDLVIVGSKTPHVWSCSPEYYKPQNKKLSKAICVQFEEDFLGKHFFGVPEVHRINDLLDRSKRGVRFIGNGRNEIAKYVEELHFQVGMKRLLHLITILDIMSLTKDFHYLSSLNYSVPRISKDDTERMEIIYNYVLSNFTKEISLKEVSSLVSMVPHSFCRYFKSKFNNVFSLFVNEVRIGHSCKLLIENKLSVSQICYESGFNHLSNFNKQFKKMKGMTPSQFQEKFYNKSLGAIEDQ